MSVHPVRDGPMRGGAIRDVAVLVAVLGGLVLAGWAVGSILARHTPAFDLSSARWFADHRTSSGTTLARAITQLGGTAVLVPLAVLVGVAATVTAPAPRSSQGIRRPARAGSAARFVPVHALSWASLRAAVFLAVTFVGVELIMRVVKEAAGRARPPVHLAAGHFGDPAFPSAHVMLAVTMLGSVAVLVAGSARSIRPGGAARWRRVTWATAGIAMVAVALTRLYLGAHWPTDVVGGAALAGAWLVAVTVVIRPT